LRVSCLASVRTRAFSFYLSLSLFLAFSFSLCFWLGLYFLLSESFSPPLACALSFALSLSLTLFLALALALSSFLPRTPSLPLSDLTLSPSIRCGQFVCALPTTPPLFLSLYIRGKITDCMSMARISNEIQQHPDVLLCQATRAPLSSNTPSHFFVLEILACHYLSFLRAFLRVPSSHRICNPTHLLHYLFRVLSPPVEFSLLLLLLLLSFVLLFLLSKTITSTFFISFILLFALSTTSTCFSPSSSSSYLILLQKN